MSDSRRLLIGAALVIIAIAVVALTQILPGSGSSGGLTPSNVQVVRGYLGGEKTGLLDDPEVQKLLRDRYHLSVDGRKAGSIEMVRDIALTDQDDFLWPSSQVALAFYKQNPGAKLAKSDNLLNSPIVLYSWAEVTDALIKIGVVEKLGESYYIVDFPRLIQLVNDGKQWSDIGLPQLHGRISIHTTDPTLSNSGNLFAGLLANTFNGGEVVDDASVERVLPQLKLFFTRLGFMEQSSSDLFQQYLTTGMGAKPMIAGYESQLIEFSVLNEGYRGQLKDKVRVLYPRPTVWSSHPLIARDDAGVRLLEALKDKDIQDLAWKRHGFRSGLVGVQNDPSVLQVVGVPETVQSVIDMPSPSVMDRIIQTLSAQIGSPTPTPSVR